MTQLLDEKSNSFFGAVRQGPGIRRRGRPHHRSGREVHRSQKLRLHPNDDGEQRRHRAAHQRCEPDRDRRNDANARPTAGRHAKRRRCSARRRITRTLEDLHKATRAAIEESKQTASATVADMLETHGMLRSDTTALFERLREANILLQEVLSGAHENMSSLEHTMVTRVAEFVTAMNDVTAKSDTSAAIMEAAVGSFNAVTANALRELGELASQFNVQGRSLAEAVELLEKSNQRTEESVATKHAQHRSAGRDAGHPHRRFRAAAEALLRPARRIARCGDDAGARDRRHHRRDQQQQRADYRAAIRARARDLGGRAQAHQREFERGLRRGRRRRCTACSTNPPSDSPRSCRA